MIKKYIILLLLLTTVSCDVVKNNDTVTDDTVGVIVCILDNKTAIVNEIIIDCKKSDKEYIIPKKYKKQTMSNIIQYCIRELEKLAQITPDGNVTCISK